MFSQTDPPLSDSPVIRHILSIVAAILLCTATAFRAEAELSMLFSPVDDRGGNPHIRSILPLDDGRIAFATLEGIDIFDGSGFSRHPLATSDLMPLPGYKGYHHLYLSDGEERLWFKNHNELRCLDLTTGIFATDMPSLMDSLGLPRQIDDFFTDHEGRIWVVVGDTIIRQGSRIGIPLPENKSIIDMSGEGDTLFLFTKDGGLEAFSRSSGEHLYSSRGYDAGEDWKFGQTSLVVIGSRGHYQIRNGAIGGLFRFDPGKQTYEKVFESSLRLNTMAIAGDTAYISTNNGLVTVDLQSGIPAHNPLIRTESGNMLASEISTIASDRQNGLWLGLLDRGILHSHPGLFRHMEIAKDGTTHNDRSLPSSVFSENRDHTVTISRPGGNLKVSLADGSVTPDNTSPSSSMTGEYGSGRSFISSDGSIFFNDPEKFTVFIKNDSIPTPCPVKPVMQSILVNGEEIKVLGAYDGNTILDKSPAHTEEITLLPHQNFLTLRYSLPDYSSSRRFFSYMLEGIDREWHEENGEGKYNRLLSAHYTALPPGEYTFRVRDASSPSSPEARLSVRVLPRWWQTVWARILFVAVFIAVTAAAVMIYISRSKKKFAREQREKYLLDRVRNLIEEVDRYKTEAPDSHAAETMKNSEEKIAGEKRNASLSESDMSFIAKAVETVEKNLDTPGYSVVQLSRDLCMERTGLYRKLTALLEQSPSIFIRDIRLRNVARLLEEQKLSISDIAEKTGFCSTSYMSRCFQERYGCRPSEYVANSVKKQ